MITYIYIEPVGVLSRQPKEYKPLAYPDVGEPAPMAEAFVRALGHAGPLAGGGNIAMWKMLTTLFPTGSSYASTPRMNEIWSHLLRWNAPRIDGIKNLGTNRIDAVKYDHRYAYGVKADQLRWIVILPVGLLTPEEMQSAAHPEVKDRVFFVDHTRGKYELLWTAADVYSKLGFDVGPESALATIFNESK